MEREAIEVMAEAIHEVDAGIDQTSYNELATAALDALTKPRTEKCTDDWHKFPPLYPHVTPCPSCSGSGTVTRGPIAVLVPPDAVSEVTECEHCDGRGWVQVDGYPEENERDFCPECGGGVVSDDKALYLYRVVTRHGRLVVSAEVGGLTSAQRVVDDLDVTFWNDGPHRIERRRYTEWEPVEEP